MTIADDILDLLKRKRRLKLTAIDLAEMLSWEDKSFRHRVQAGCSSLHEQGRLLRDGKGSLSDPYTYSVAPTERRCAEPK
jgi:hypothetical protein